MLHVVLNNASTHYLFIYLFILVLALYFFCYLTFGLLLIMATHTCSRSHFHPFPRSHSCLCDPWGSSVLFKTSKFKIITLENYRLLQSTAGPLTRSRHQTPLCVCSLFSFCVIIQFVSWSSYCLVLCRTVLCFSLRLPCFQTSSVKEIRETHASTAVCKIPRVVEQQSSYCIYIFPKST